MENITNIFTLSDNIICKKLNEDISGFKIYKITNKDKTIIVKITELCLLFWDKDCKIDSDKLINKYNNEILEINTKNKDTILKKFGNS